MFQFHCLRQRKFVSRSMARKRNKEHEGLPARWRIKGKVYYYQVPKGQEDHWDGKIEFRLGGTLSEAHRTFAGRIASADDVVKTFGQLFDRYLFEVTPTKGKRTQKDEVIYLTRLRGIIHQNDVRGFEPHHAYRLRDLLKTKSVKGSGEKYANRHMALLKHVFTKAIEWGIINSHPMTESKFKMFPEAKSQLRVPTIEEVKEAAKIANPMLKAYIGVKVLTGLRHTDILLLRESDISASALTVNVHKTKQTVDKVLEFEMTPELRDAIRACRAIKPLSIHLFHNKWGQCYVKADMTTSGFESQWQRWQQKLPKTKRFAERSIRTAVGYEDDLQTASNRMGHTSTATTQKYYRSNINKVTPLSSY